MAVRKKFGPALGRGLDALISTEDVRTEGSSTINEIDISLIERNPNQPRREFDEEALKELASSSPSLCVSWTMVVIRLLRVSDAGVLPRRLVFHPFPLIFAPPVTRR